MNAPPTPTQVYKSLMEQAPMIRDPNSTYWQARFSAAARRLAALLGAERYNAWYERRFPGEGLLSQYTWQEKHDRTEAVLERAAKLHAFEAPERAR